MSLAVGLPSLRTVALFGGVVACLVGCYGERAEPPGEEESAAPINARATVDHAVATTGDVLRFEVVVDHQAGLEVEIPEVGEQIEGFRLLDLGGQAPVERRDGRVEEGRWYELRADLVGSYVLPSVSVRYRPLGDGDEAAWQSVSTSQIFVEVESVLPADGEATDIRDIKPLHDLPSPGPSPWWLVAILAALSALGAWAWWRRRREARPTPVVPPHEAAFAALRDLRQTDFDDPLAVRRFYFHISEVLRAYLEGRFGCNATDLTTEEILPQLGALALSEEWRQRLADWLRHTDDVKFAAHEPGPEQIESTYDAALGFVETTRPGAEVETPAEPEAVAA